MHAFAVAADEMMPARQRLTKGRKPVAAGMRQPVQFQHILGRHLDAVGHVLLTVGIVTALVGVEA